MLRIFGNAIVLSVRLFRFHHDLVLENLAWGVAAACLANDKDAGTCFSIGYIYGAQAFNAK